MYSGVYCSKGEILRTIFYLYWLRLQRVTAGNGSSFIDTRLTDVTV